MEESEDDDSDLDEDFGVGQLTHDLLLQSSAISCKQ